MNPCLLDLDKWRSEKQPLSHWSFSREPQKTDSVFFSGGSGAKVFSFIAIIFDTAFHMIKSFIFPTGKKKTYWSICVVPYFIWSDKALPVWKPQCLLVFLAVWYTKWQPLLLHHIVFVATSFAARKRKPLVVDYINRVAERHKLWRANILCNSPSQLTA